MAPIAALPAVTRIGRCEDDSGGNNHGITEIWNITKVLVSCKLNSKANYF